MRASTEETLVLSAVTSIATVTLYRPGRAVVPETSAKNACQREPGNPENVSNVEPEGPVTFTIPIARTTPVTVGVDQFNRRTALPNAAEVAFAFTTVCSTRAVSSK